MFWITKKSIKGLPKKLKAILEDIEYAPTNTNIHELQEILTKIVNAFNDKDYNRDDLPKILNQKLYRDQTIELLIKLMPILDQQMNNLISTFLQISEKEFPDSSFTLPKYLLSHSSALSTLFSYIDDPKLFSVANIILRECIKEESFLTYLYEKKYVSSFLRFLNGENFELLTSAFKTYEVLLMSKPEVSAHYISEDYDIYALEMKALLASHNYITRMIILPLLSNFLTQEPCRSLLMNFVNDPENLCLIIVLLGSKSKKIKLSAYYLFKLFVINPRRSPAIKSILHNNKEKLTNIIKKLRFPDDDEDLNDERDVVIQNIAH